MKKYILSFAAIGAAIVLGLSACNKGAEKTETSDETTVVESAENATLETEGKNVDPVPNHYEKYFSENADKEDVKSTPSGLKYVVVKEGTGISPNATDNVTVHYTGTLINGTVFDSSVSRGVPTTFPLNQVIPGWTEGLQLMKEGGKTIFYIPSELAYGPRELPGIPANSPLIFEVELIKVN